jgi:hypothetical protein
MNQAFGHAVFRTDIGIILAESELYEYKLIGWLCCQAIDDSAV